MFSYDKKARRAIEELSEEFSKLQREFKSLEMEWSNAYDKLLTMMQRVAKRAEVLQKEMDGGRKPLSPAEEVLVGIRPGSPGFGFMTPAQKRMQEQILARRAASGANKSDATEE